MLYEPLVILKNIKWFFPQMAPKILYENELEIFTTHPFHTHAHTQTQIE